MPKLKIIEVPEPTKFIVPFPPHHRELLKFTLTQYSHIEYPATRCWQFLNRESAEKFVAEAEKMGFKEAELTSLPEILEYIIDHHAFNPTHGLDCACMDKAIRAFKQMIHCQDYKLQQRIDYVLRSALS